MAEPLPISVLIEVRSASDHSAELCGVQHQTERGGREDRFCLSFCLSCHRNAISNRHHMNHESLLNINGATVIK